MIRITVQESMYIQFLYKENGIRIKDLMRQYQAYSSATIYFHVKYPSDERNLLSHLKRLCASIGPFTLERLVPETRIWMVGNQLCSSKAWLLLPPFTM